MKEPNADDSANISKTPTIKITLITGTSHHIFLSLINVNRSFKNSIIYIFNLIRIPLSNYQIGPSLADHFYKKEIH